MSNLFLSEFFAGNRRKLYKQLQPGSCIAMVAPWQMQRNTDIAHSYDPEPNFWYLTGIDHPEWWFLADVDSGQEWLVAPHVAAVIQAFDGSLDVEGAKHQSGINQVLNPKEGRAKLHELLNAKQHAYALKPAPRVVYGTFTNPAQQEMWRRLAATDRQDARLLIARQRAIKQPLELQALQQAVDISVDGAMAMLKDVRSYSFEYEAEARLDYEFRRAGADLGFETIVAAGSNACTIHHMADDSPIKPNDWLLFDIGPRINHYMSDIARTVPLGDITPRQQAVYDVLLRVHDHVQSLLRPGQNVRNFLEETDNIMMHEMAGLGLIKEGDYKSYRQQFPQAIGHGLGLDPHDPLGRPEVFLENMIMTIEPGMYIPKEGIGMRLESVAHIKADRAHLMSGRLPLDIAGLQALLG